MASPAAPQMPLVDIGANLLSDQFRGVYHGRRRHRPDLDAVLARAAAAGVRAVFVTASDLRDARAALRLCRRVYASGRHAGLRLFSTCGVHPLSTAAELDAVGDDGAAGEEGAGEAEEDDDLAADRRAHPSRPADAAAYAAALRDVLRDGASDGTLIAVGECGLEHQFRGVAPGECRTERQAALRRTADDVRDARQGGDGRGDVGRGAGRERYVEASVTVTGCDAGWRVADQQECHRRCYAVPRAAARLT